MILLTFREVITREKEHLTKRRTVLEGNTQADNIDDTLIGIASSGGGIRSATINLGFLEVLSQCGILQQADYHSTVSGGGYTGSFVQGTLRETGSYDNLFSTEKVAHLRNVSSNYMAPGGSGSFVQLILGYLMNLCFSYVNPLIIIGIIYWTTLLITDFFSFDIRAVWTSPVQFYFLNAFAVLLALHFFSSVLYRYSLHIFKKFINLEIAFAVIYLAWLSWALVWTAQLSAHSARDVADKIVILLFLVTLGFFTHPDAFSFGKYYQAQLANAFLRFAGSFRDARLCDLAYTEKESPGQFLAPYPLINTCVNLVNSGGDSRFKGSSTQDYFLLSPLFCGSKLTGYVPTTFKRGFRMITLPAAIGISAAAVNAGMGTYSNSLLSFFVTVFNARLGHWVPNPLSKSGLVWGPLYFIGDLLSRKGSDKALVNISDGGHIENLGVYELLRRKCRLIICIDASADPDYTFEDLVNLIRRARNELGLEIRFRQDQHPQTLIKPDISGFSKMRFSIADIYQWWDNQTIVNPETQTPEYQIVNYDVPRKAGTFVYVKSSVRAPQGRPALSEREDPLKYGTYKYKLYNLTFPHDSTADQFYAPIQWESYRQLGRYLACDMLNVGQPEEATGKITREQLFAFFDHGISLFREPAAGEEEHFE